MKLTLLHEEDPMLEVSYDTYNDPVTIEKIDPQFRGFYDTWMQDSDYIVAHDEEDGGYEGRTNGLDDIRAFEQRVIMLVHLLGEGWAYDVNEDGLTKGGAGSGNFDHAGRPGEVGGSGEGGAAPILRERQEIETQDSAQRWGSEAYTAWANSLTTQEKNALGKYQGPRGEYVEINRYLRGKWETGQQNIGIKVVKERIAHIDAALEKATLPTDVTVYRGATLSRSMIENTLIPGASIKDRAFVSTTLIRKYAAEHTTELLGNRDIVEFRIEAQKGAKGAFLDTPTLRQEWKTTTGQQDMFEAEVLFPRNSQFIVVSKERINTKKEQYWRVNMRFKS